MTFLSLSSGLKTLFTKYIHPRSVPARRIYVFTVLIALLMAILSSDFVPKLDVALGQPSPQTIKANKSIQFEDVEQTEEQRRKAEEEVGLIYSYDVSALDRSLSEIQDFFDQIRAIQLVEGIVFEEKVDLAKSRFPDLFSEEALRYLLALSSEKLKEVEAGSIEVTRRIMEEKITSADLPEQKNKVQEVVDSVSISADDAPVVAQIVKNYLRPTAYYDQEETEKAQREARLSVSPVIVSVKKGELIVQEGVIVDDRTMLILEKLGLLQQSFDWKRALSTFLLLAGGSAVLFIYMRKFNQEIYGSPRLLALLALVTIVFTAVAKLFALLSDVHASFWGYLIPVSAVAMLTTILFEARLSIIHVFFVSLITGIATGFDFSFVMVNFLGGIFATYFVSQVSYRQEVMKGGLLTALSLAYLIFATNIPFSDNIPALLYNMSMGGVNGVVGAIFTIGALPFLESTFGITTGMSLVELINPNNPLLKKLLIEAPGTYNHSLVVGNLAESAAEAIGADSLLVRVGAYFHDIGKLKRPYFFSENQLGENVHDDINPGLSRLVVINHVKDGVEMAGKERLPKLVIDCIQQHHGTSIISYFYDREKKLKNKEIVDEQTFRYPGRKPQTKEAATLMLADAVEATARSLSSPTPNHLQQMTRDIIYNRLADGQLDECNLTLREINKIVSAFSQVLLSIYHVRVKYPEETLKPAPKRIVAGGNTNK